MNELAQDIVLHCSGDNIIDNFPNTTGRKCFYLKHITVNPIYFNMKGSQFSFFEGVNLFTANIPEIRYNNIAEVVNALQIAINSLATTNTYLLTITGSIITISATGNFELIASNLSTQLGFYTYNVISTSFIGEGAAFIGRTTGLFIEFGGLSFGQVYSTTIRDGFHDNNVISNGVNLYVPIDERDYYIFYYESKEYKEYFPQNTQMRVRIYDDQKNLLIHPINYCSFHFGVS